MKTKKRIRPSRTSNNNMPRYTTGKASVAAHEETTEQQWIVFVLAFFLLIGVGFVSAISYVLLLG